MAPEPSLPRKGLLELRDAVEAASFICIGTVDEVRSVTLPPSELHAGPGQFTRLPFGRIVVERVLKGDAQTAIVFHEAWSTWKCDTTNSHRGQRAVFFLATGTSAAMPEDARAQITSHLGDHPILRNLGSGDGIVPFRIEGEEQTVSFEGAPNALRLAATRPDLPAAKGRRILADVFVDHVANLCRFDPATVAIHALALVPVRSGEKAFDLRVTSTGSARLAIGDSVEESVRLFDLEPAAWSALRTGLVELMAAEPITFGAAAPFRPQRILKVSLDGRRLSFDEAGNLLGTRIDAAQRPSMRTSLRAWSLVRSAIDCAECVDHRALDASFLAD